MADKLSILINTLAQMSIEAEEKGVDHIQPHLSHTDVKLICHELSIRTREKTACEIRAASEFDDTVAGMLSADYKERFKAEYRQTKIRYDKLHKMLVKADAGTLEFNLTCPLELLKDQKMHMGRYLYCLEVRAQIECIEL